MKLLQFLTHDPDTPRGTILFMASVAGAANTLLLALVNSAAEQLALGAPNPSLLLLYVIGFALYIQTQHYALTRSVRVVESALQRLKLSVADKVRRSDLRFIEQFGGISSFAPLSQDAGMVSQGVIVLVQVANSILLLACASLYLFFLSPLSLIAMLVIYAVLAPIYINSYRRARDELLLADRTDAIFFERFTGILDGFKELKLNRRESDELFASIGSTADQAYEIKRSCNVQQAKSMVVRRTINYLVLFAVVFLVPTLVTESTGTILKVTATALFMLGPLTLLMDSSPTLAMVDAAVTSLFNLDARLDERKASADGLSPAEPLDGFQRIDLEALSFHYEDRNGQNLFTVGPLDFTLRRGELIFIVGGNGSGKSTLLKLLAGLYRPDHGRILLDGQAVSNEDRPRYRTLFTSVFNDFHLFEQIYGIPDLDPARVNEMLADLGLAHTTRYTDEGFTNLELSTGQKKRMAFIGSLLKDRPICLFDELAADQDPRFRRRFYEQILPDLRAQGRTLLVVSHDDQYFHTADRVLHLRDGQLSEVA